MKKGEIARYKQFLLSHSVFYSFISIVRQNVVLCGNWLNKNVCFIFTLHKFLDMTKLKAFADDKLNVAKITASLCDRVEKSVEKEENAGNQHFFHFPQCFPKPSSLGSLKVGIVWQRVK